MMISFQNYLRSNDLTKASLIVSFIFNIINVILNALFLYVFKIDPILSVAFGSVISRGIGVIILYITYKKKVGISLHQHKKIYSEIQPNAILKYAKSIPSNPCKVKPQK